MEARAKDDLPTPKKQRKTPKSKKIATKPKPNTMETPRLRPSRLRQVQIVHNLDLLRLQIKAFITKDKHHVENLISMQHAWAKLPQFGSIVPPAPPLL